MQSDAPFDQIFSHEESVPRLTSSGWNFKSQSKIQPISIIRKSLPNSPKIRAKLGVNAYKNFSKVSASGPHSLQILQKIKKSSNSKIAYTFEFDPYLCDESCLTELVTVLKKIKTIKKLSLTIRRLNHFNEFNNIRAICLILSKLLRLRKLRIELPSTSNIAEIHILTIYRALKKCYTLKSLEWVIVESPLLSEEYFQIFLLLMRKLRKLEYYKDYMTTKDGIPNNDYSFNSNKINNIPKRPQLKHLDLMHSAPKEWSSMADHGDDNHDFLIQYFSSYPGLESYKLKLVKTSFQSQDMLLLSKCFVSFVNLRHFDIEFLNCEIDDLKFGICMYSLSQIPQLKYIRFKIIQKTQISIDYIEKSIEKVSNMINLEKFDFYFRK